MFNNLTDINIIYDESLCSWKLCVSSGQTNLKQNHRHSCTPENFCIFLRFSALSAHIIGIRAEMKKLSHPYIPTNMYCIGTYASIATLMMINAQDDVPCTYDDDG